MPEFGIHLLSGEMKTRPAMLSTTKRTSNSMTFNQRNHRILDAEYFFFVSACSGLQHLCTRLEDHQREISNVSHQSLDGCGVVNVGESCQVGRKKEVVQKLRI